MESKIIERRLMSFTDFINESTAHVANIIKYGDLKIGDIKVRDAKQEYEYVRKQTGNTFDQDDHPLTMFGYYIRHLFAVSSEKYSIEQFDKVYFPMLEYLKVSDRKNTLDLFYLYGNYGIYSNSLNNENGKQVLLDCINIINTGLTKIRNNITEKAFDHYLNSVRDKELDISLVPRKFIDSSIKYIYARNDMKGNNYNSYPFSLLKIMYEFDDDEYFNKFLSINGISNIIDEVSSKMSSALVNNSNYTPIANILKNLDNELEKDRSEYMSIYNKNWFENWQAGDSTENAIDNYYSGVLSLFYIKGYLDFTYYKLYDTSHKQSVIGFSTGVDTSKAAQDVQKSQPAVIKPLKPSIIGIFGGDTGESNLTKSNGASQLVANMQVTILIILTSPFTDQDKMNSLISNEDNRFSTEIKRAAMINRDVIKVGKPVEFDSILNDGMFGSRTQKMIKLFQTIFKESGVVPKDIRNEIQINGVYDKQTKNTVNHIVNNYFGDKGTIKSEIALDTDKKNSIFDKPKQSEPAKVAKVGLDD